MSNDSEPAGGIGCNRSKLGDDVRPTSRRAFLAAAGSFAAGALIPGAARAMAEEMHTYPGVRFGVQLNAFPIDPKNFQSFLDTIATVKQIGYQGFESSFRNVESVFGDPAPARRKIEATGLTFFGIHIFFPSEGYDPQMYIPSQSYDPETHIAAPAIYEPVGRGGVALGAKHLILSGAPCVSEEQLKRKIEALNAAGKFAQSLGITAAYHNHWWEFRNEVAGISEIDALYTQTDPSLVHFVLDAGHAYHGGANVPVFIRAHAKRIIGFHLRDYKNGRLSTLGTGTFPLAEVAHTIEQIGWKGWVENEEEREDLSKNGTEVIRPAFKAMEEAFKI